MSRERRSGPVRSALGPPSSTTWRRERLLRIGSSHSVSIAELADDAVVESNPDAAAPSESTPLQDDLSASYGTLPRRRKRPPRLYRMGSLNGEFMHSAQIQPATPLSATFREAYSRLSALSQRPISAYDAHLGFSVDELDAKINGIRVWYSSYTSIDWLHDAIKDAARFSRLRRRKSWRAQIRLLFDRSLGWIIVTIVGFLTAVVAFLIARSEQWLFDMKEGYCAGSWLSSKRICCPPLDETVIFIRDEACPAWRTWQDLWAADDGEVDGWVEFGTYTTVALLLALVSCLLTLYLTKSTTFMTRKESGVLGPGFVEKTENSSTQRDRRVFYYAAGSGIPEVKTILSGFVIHGYLGGRVLFTKAVGLALSVASGLSLGKEGPFVHMASCVGNIVSRFASKYENNEAKRREILSAACAAGVAVAFGAPIGGTLFSLEEVSYFFPPKPSFFCAMIAALTLRVLDPFGTGKLVLFQVTYDKDWHVYELFSFLLLGVFGGIYGAYFSKLNFRWSLHVRNGTSLKDHPIVEVLLITLLTAALCFLNPYTRMGGTELVYNLFAECRTGSGNNHSGLCVVDPGSWEHVWPIVRAIIVAMIVKGSLTIVTFGIKVPAGIFIPSLGVGACAGRVMGIFVQYLQAHHPNARYFRSCGGDLDCVVPGLYAMVGAAATLSGVTRTTVSLAVIMFELTNTLTYVVPVMLSVLVAKTVADAIEPKGIYDLVIDVSQLPYLDTKHEYLWGTFQVSDVTVRDAETIKLSERNTVKSLRDKLQALLLSGNDDSGFPILRQAEDACGYRMVGYIGSNELEHALSIVADEANQEVIFRAFSSHYTMASSISSLLEEESVDNPFDFGPYMDQAPLQMPSNSPLELLHQFFVKLGAKYVIITDADGLYEGIIDKKTWLAFLNEVDEK
ncbi:hypothetical protein FISHEDRAFT_66304 [Fistulina hepatica ATCC 64428]|uniref:Chloride channel protein n=1 Tax=Fistulina hepatica ATCC 64428 TaxID=1128425 RepID=A0A0D7A7G9_9AGAR|nr:hypothetical protein FISHEDRAFT_66304 [Fistulina hepatica ATCC 64428]